MASKYPLYVLIQNDEAKESMICRRVDNSGTATVEGTYTPHAVGARVEMRQLFRDLTVNN